MKIYACVILLSLIILLASCSNETTKPITIVQTSSPAQLVSAENDSVITKTETITVAAETKTSPTHGPASARVTATATIQNYSYRIIQRIPHDSDAFTQGFVFNNGNLYESTGQYGRSTIRKFNLKSEQIEQIFHLSNDLFGEGLTIVHDKLIQLTWKTHKGLIYDLYTLNKLDEFYYPTEGWGLTYDGQNLIMSDGTSTIRYLDPVNFQEIRKIEVTEDGQPLENINELEYINGKIYANIWKTAQIAIIDPQNGTLLAWINLSDIFQNEFPQIEEINYLNGIAYDKENDRLFITGKNWPAVFEIEIVD